MRLEDCYQEIVEKWYNGRSREFIDFAVNAMDKNWNERKIFIIEAPTGYGKSTISAAIALYNLKYGLKSIIAYPLRTLLEDQYRKLLNLPGINAKLLGKRYMHNLDSLYLIKPVTLTTVDTLSLTLFGIPPEDLSRVAKFWDGTSYGTLGHYLFAWASVVLSDLVLDEVHLLADSTKSLNFLIALMKTAVAFDQKLILMSATLPESLKNTMLRYAGESAAIIEFSKDQAKSRFSYYDEEFVRERLEKKYRVSITPLEKREKFDRILWWIKEFEGRRVLVVFNNVSDAIELYQRLGDHSLLLHSRFTEADREKKIAEIMKPRKNFVIVSTQVIEAGVDMSSDVLITDIAPANSLIQRAGRFLRYDEKEGEIYIWYDPDELVKERYIVYDSELVRKTLETLKILKNAELNFHVPEKYRQIINSVYTDPFTTDENRMKKFEKIFLHLEDASRKAIELFFEMEGSFVRDGLQVPVTWKESIENSSKDIVPLSYDMFESLFRKGDVQAAIADGRAVNAKEVLGSRISPQKVLSIIMRKGIEAFVVNAEYSSELGLRW